LTDKSDKGSGGRGFLGKLRMPRFKPRTPAEKRRLIVRGGMVALALVAFVFAPGYISTRPTFFDRYESLEEPYQAWTQSFHAGVSCQACHVPANLPMQLGYDVRMIGEFYLSIVAPSRQPALFESPTNGACSRCHMDLRTVSPSGDLNIPHRAHVEMLKMDCVDCHDFLVHSISPEGKNTPPMAGCLTCHDGETAKADCNACHTDKDAPDDHREQDWLVVHPQKVTGGECNTCHDWTEHWCADCHSKRPVSHTEDWRKQHRNKVEERRNCEACHEGDFCVRCHGEVPQRNFDPLLKISQ
jgi:hypothetical protein